MQLVQRGERLSQSIIFWVIWDGYTEPCTGSTWQPFNNGDLIEIKPPHWDGRDWGPVLIGHIFHTKEAAESYVRESVIS